MNTYAMKYSHNSTYLPPCPEITIILRNEDTDLSTQSLPALLDTGADASFVPLHHLRKLRAYVIQEAFVRSHWGDRHRVHLFRIDIVLDGLTLVGMNVVGDEYGSEVILGRDVINRLRLFLDGPGSATEVFP
ncbi:MAG: hypothetical protein K1X65_20170 [Caldilineales bacterium]|nr:hypothetical protein [Caldilineales bacterium]